MNCSAIERQGAPASNKVVFMDRLTSMTVFAKVATTRSFPALPANSAFRRPLPASMSRRLRTGWEHDCCTVQTRRVALTDAGESFFVQCSRILEDMEMARTAAKPEAPVRGAMRITAPVAFGSTRLGPLVVDFMGQHPELSLSVEFRIDLST